MFSGIGLTQLIMILFGLFIYCLPTVLAVKKQHRHKVPIIILNLVGGLIWGLGWFASLIWVLVPTTSHVNNSADELRKLHELKESGVLTQAEFDQRKAAILAQ